MQAENEKPEWLRYCGPNGYGEQIVIGDPTNKNKSVLLTQEGEPRAELLCRKLFAR